jgi:HEAT repeat protein
LASYPTRDGVALAGDLIDDPSSMVRRQVVASLAEWPLRQAGPVLLAAMAGSGYLTRQAAAGHLAALWPPAAEFPVHGPPERRAEVLERLKRRLRQEIGLVDPEVLAALAAGDSAPPISPEKVAQVEQQVRNLADPGLPEPVRQWSIASLADFGPGLVEALGQLALDRSQTLPEAVYRQVLPGYDRAFVVLDRLASDDVAVRRRAAEELIEMTTERPLGRLAAARLASLVLSEADALVWQRVLTAVVSDPSEPAVRLAYAAISHPSPDVRRRACEHLAAHPEPSGRHANVLLPALEDEDASVVLAAVRALGVSGPVIDPQPLRRLLISRNESLRVEVAIALARLGDPAGPAALERLAYSNDEAVRRRVAVAMGEIGDAGFTPSLVRLLDDRHSIRLAALESLPQVVGHDVAESEQPSPRSLGERLDCWKRWFARQHGTIALRPPANGAAESIDRLPPGPR